MTPKERMLSALRGCLMALEQMPEDEVQESFTGGYRDVVVTVRYFAPLAAHNTGKERDK